MAALQDWLIPAGFVVVLWWASTGLVLWLNRRPRATFRTSMLGASLVGLVGLVLLHATRADTGVGGAYLAFAAALAVWAWVETSFLLGFVTGPRRTACPRGCDGAAHFMHGVQAVLHHEIALVLAAFATWCAVTDGANAVGLQTFVALWVMRVSAKLNVFLGVRNLTEEFLPPHLRYLESFFSRRPMNVLFPVSVTLGTAAAVVFCLAAATAASEGEAVGSALVGTLLALAVVEHWFMVLPVSLAGLWTWGFGAARGSSAAPRTAVDEEGSGAGAPVVVLPRARNSGVVAVAVQHPAGEEKGLPSRPAWAR